MALAAIAVLTAVAQEAANDVRPSERSERLQESAGTVVTRELFVPRPTAQRLLREPPADPPRFFGRTYPIPDPPPAEVVPAEPRTDNGESIIDAARPADPQTAQDKDSERAKDRAGATQTERRQEVSKPDKQNRLRAKPPARAASTDKDKARRTPARAERPARRKPSPAPAAVPSKRRALSFAPEREPAPARAEVEQPDDRLVAGAFSTLAPAERQRVAQNCREVLANGAQARSDELSVCRSLFASE